MTRPILPLALFLGACLTPNTSPRAPLHTQHLGTSAAEYLGTFSRGGESETAPKEVPPEVILDSITLTQRSPETCFELMLNTEASYDQPLESLAPKCLIDDKPKPVKIIEERHNMASYEFERSSPWTLFEKTFHVFPSVVRFATLCCPEPTFRSASLTLSNKTFGYSDHEPWHLTATFELATP